ncbi:MAG: glucose 1-dehydrogenase [Spirochaetaceae bacterium]|nr:glucose 1-dehydrogenase [Spirochaetaceae bacterium]MCF7938671.1 glucose 1-dehydrogenase [Spirochaetales bacterium]
MGSQTSGQGILERFRLDGRTVLVTGGGQGIGRSFCHALGEAGAKVAVVDLNQEVADEVSAELSAKGIEAMPVRADVTDPEAVEKMVSQVVDRWGGLTIAVNNAGMGLWCDAETMDYREWRKLIDLNLNAVYLCAQAESRVMLEAGYGKIINTASMSAHISNTPQNQAAYNTSKAGVLHLSRSLAAEWAPRGIRVNSISPGYTKTALVEKLLESPEGKTMLPKWIEKIPMGRMAETEDLQGAVVFLAAGVSDYMTGADLLIDGGYCTW